MIHFIFPDISSQWNIFPHTVQSSATSLADSVGWRQRIAATKAASRQFECGMSWASLRMSCLMNTTRYKGVSVSFAWLIADWRILRQTMLEGGMRAVPLSHRYAAHICAWDRSPWAFLKQRIDRFRCATCSVAIVPRSVSAVFQCEHALWPDFN